MLIKDYIAAFPYLIKSGTTPYVIGFHGIGKSEVPRQICDKEGWHFTDVRLGNMSDVGDLIGLPDFEVDSKGKKISTKFFIPDWLREAIDFAEKNPDKYSIVHFDEANRCRADLKAPIFQIALDKQLHTTKFPKNLFCIFSANPNTDDYCVNDYPDKALHSRFCFIKLSPSVTEWSDYAASCNYDSTIINFINEQPGMLEKKGQDFNLDFVTPDRRCYKFVDKLLKAETPSNLFQELCYGIIGVPATAAYLESVKNSDKPLTGKEILKAYKKHKAMVKKWSVESGGRPDLVNSSTESLVKEIKDLQEKSKKMTDNQGNNMLEFLRDIPLDRSYAAVQDLYLEDCARDFFKEDDELIQAFAKAKGM